MKNYDEWMNSDEWVKERKRLPSQKESWEAAEKNIKDALAERVKWLLKCIESTDKSIEKSTGKVFAAFDNMRRIAKDIENLSK